MVKRILTISLCMCVVSNFSFGDITTTGDIDPTDPLTWGPTTKAYIGKNTDGKMTIDGGSYVNSGYVYLGFEDGSAGEVTVDGTGSKLRTNRDLSVGMYGNGTLNITNRGSSRTLLNTYVGRYQGSVGSVTVDGEGSTWINNALTISRQGSASLSITNGGFVSNISANIGTREGSVGSITVDGAGSIWKTVRTLYLGQSGVGTLNITDGGLVSVSSTLTVDQHGGGDSYINMSTGGMLALYGDADDSLSQFLYLVKGTDAIRYWDNSILDWADIINATYGQDYDLVYITDDSNLDGYTVLTVYAAPVQAIPIADAGVDIQLSADGQCGASVVLDGSGSYDDDGDELSYHWFYNDELFAEGVEVPIDLGLGEHVFTLIVNDGFQDSLPDEVVVTVLDDTSPGFTVSVDKSILWPANNKMVKVTPSFEVFDNCSSEVTIELVNITCNQDSENDIEITDGGIFLRAKRDPRDKAGRVYTVTYKATDNSGNEAIAFVEIKVPHDLRKRQ